MVKQFFAYVVLPNGVRVEALITLDPEEIARLIRRATKNKSRKSVCGPVHVMLTDR